MYVHIHHLFQTSCLIQRSSQVMLVAYSTYVYFCSPHGSQLLIFYATETAWCCPTAFSKDRCDQEAVRSVLYLPLLRH